MRQTLSRVVTLFGFTDTQIIFRVTIQANLVLQYTNWHRSYNNNLQKYNNAA